jgi:hypothetical protein
MEFDTFFENVITSYEERIQKIQTAFQSSENLTESSHILFDKVHNHINDLKKERDLLNSKLSETLSKNGSLRKKDYNTMMSDILRIIDEKETEAQHQFLSFIDAQKETAQSLKNSMLGLKDITSHDIGEKITAIKEQLSLVSKQQEMRKEAVMNSFTNFQQLHQQLTECLENLLKKGDQIQIKDIKRLKDQIINEIVSKTKAPNHINQ